MKRIIKGTYGYLKQKRNFIILQTIIFFAISLSLLIAGIITTGDKKNLLTIVAVLGCLPASKSLVSMIMYLKATSCTEEAKEAIYPHEKALVGMYDMYFTSYKKNFAISHMVVEGKNICGYTENPKLDKNACEAHLESHLLQGGFKDMTIKIFSDISKYTDRLDQLNTLERERTLKRDDEIRTILYEISL